MIRNMLSSKKAVRNMLTAFYKNSENIRAELSKKGTARD